MRQFLIRLGVFSSVLGVLALVSFLLNQRHFERHVYQPPQGTETWMIGDSRMKTALDPDLMPKSINISIPQLPFVINYHIVQTLAGHNTPPRHILINISPSHLSQKADFLFSPLALGRPLYFFDLCYPFMERDDWADFPVNDDLYYKSFIKNEIVPNIGYWKLALGLDAKYPYIGFFRPARKSLAKEDNREPECKTEEHFYFDGEEVGISEIDIHYVDSIARFCQQQQIELYLVNTPIHPLYSSDIPDKFTRNYDSLMNHLQTAYGAIVLDYQQQVFSDSLFRDCDHLNVSGAARFTPMIAREIGVE